VKIMQGAPRNLVLAVTAIAACLCIAACGSSSTTTTSSSGSSGTKTTASTGRSANRAKLVACLKSHGVTLPSRAGGFHPGGGSGAPGAGAFFGGGGGAGGSHSFSSKNAAAFKACGADFGGGRFRSGGFARRFSSSTLASFTACVKKNGFTLPAANTKGTGPIFSPSIEKNPKFVAAAKSCVSILSAAFRGGAGGAGTPPPAAG
jgi:hypothetical protein